MAIYLGAALPLSSSHLPGGTGPVFSPSTVLLRIEFTAALCRQGAGWSLTPPFHPYRARAAVCFCCTRPDVAIGGRYPLSLPCGARTFLTHSLSARARGHSENSLFQLLCRKRISPVGSRKSGVLRFSALWACPPLGVRFGLNRPYSPSYATRSAHRRSPRTRPASFACSFDRPRR